MAKHIAALPFHKCSNDTNYYAILALAKVAIKTELADVKEAMVGVLRRLSLGRPKVSVAVRLKASELLKVLQLDKEALAEIFESVDAADLMHTIDE